MFEVALKPRFLIMFRGMGITEPLFGTRPNGIRLFDTPGSGIRFIGIGFIVPGTWFIPTGLREAWTRLAIGGGLIAIGALMAGPFNVPGLIINVPGALMLFI
jgi:hypothetical protein